MPKNKWAVREHRTVYLCSTKPVFIKWAMGERINRWMVHDGSLWTPPGLQIVSGQCSLMSELPKKEQKPIVRALRGKWGEKAIIQLKGVA